MKFKAFNRKGDLLLETNYAYSELSDEDLDIIDEIYEKKGSEITLILKPNATLDDLNEALESNERLDEIVEQQNVVVNE